MTNICSRVIIFPAWESWKISRTILTKKDNVMAVHVALALSLDLAKTITESIYTAIKESDITS